jgi:hypothetical protein
LLEKNVSSLEVGELLDVNELTTLAGEEDDPLFRAA